MRFAVILLVCSCVGSAGADELTLEFGTVEQGVKALTQRDDFVRRMSAFDRRARMQADHDVSEREYLDFVKANILPWGAREQALVTVALDEVLPKVRALKLPWPKRIQLVLTTGAEEGNTAYTRGTTIVVPRSLASGEAKPPRRLVAHELFHVLTRTSPALKERLYAAIGYVPCGEVPLPERLRDLRITNPDAPRNDHCIRLSVDRQSSWAVPVLYAREPYKGGLFFDYLQFEFLFVQMQGEGAKARAHYQDFAAVLIPPDRLGGLYEQIGRNTDYIIHPEETLAENFTMLVLGETPKSPEITDKLRSVLATR